MNRRKEALEALIRYDPASSALFERMREFPFDWKGPPLAVVTAAEVFAVLDSFLTGRIDAGQLSEWGNALEGRDDLTFESANEAKLKDVIFRIANPEINEALSSESIKKLRMELNESLG